MTETQKDQLIVISAIGTDKPGIVNQLAKVCAQHEGNIIDSRMTVLGGEFAVLMMVRCEDAHADALQMTIEEAAEALELKTIIKRTTERTIARTVAYSVSVIALDNPGIVRDIASFFSERTINIEDMQTGTYSAPHTGTKMFSLKMVINIPADTQIANLKDTFIDFCDEKNLDAHMEPAK